MITCPYCGDSGPPEHFYESHTGGEGELIFTSCNHLFDPNDRDGDFLHSEDDDEYEPD